MLIALVRGDAGHLGAAISCRRPTAMVLAFSLALAVVWTPHSPLADSLALSGVRRFGSNYCAHAHLGLDRLSLPPISSAASFSRPAAKRSCRCLLIACFAGTLAAALPDAAARPPAARLAAVGRRCLQAAPSLAQALLPVFRRRRRRSFTASHAFLYGFVSIYWKSLGICDSDRRPSVGAGGGRGGRHVFALSPGSSAACRPAGC